jgi:ATP/maltotriose-dependent transcriptional regulator MalT
MLEEHDGLVAFRHELARRAVLDSLPSPDRAELHARALAALRSGVVPADAIRLATHAIEAGDRAAIAEHVPAAAEQASRLGAHDEAADHLAVVLAVPDSLKPRTRGELLERYAYECSVADRIAASRSAEETALGIWRELEDPLREGDGLRALATYMWLGGEGDRARETARAAVELLERLPARGRELARAYAKLAQLILVSAQDDAHARSAAAKALEIAERVGDEPVAVHALTTLAIAEIYPGIPTGWARLEEARQRAAAAGLAEDVVRVLINFVEAARDLKQYALADRYVDESIAFLRDHDFGLYRSLLSSRIAQLALDRGRWDVAEREAKALLDGGARSTIARGRALEVLGRLRARRGERGADAALDEALRIMGPGELQDLCPLLAARAEAAWLSGDIDKCGDEAARGIELAAVIGAPFWYSELSFWAWRAGRIAELPEGTEEPYILFAGGRHRAAADAWAAIGSPYQAAAALAESPVEADLRDALAILQPLRATALAGRVSARLRDLGAQAIPRGPRPSTSANALGLTRREAEVLALIRRGARNSDIADQLVLSPKTVDHHVSAVLRKLRVSDREAARREADRLGLEDGELGRPD